MTFVAVVLIRALFDAYGHVGSFLAFLPPSAGKFIASANGTVFLVTAGLFLLWWGVRQQSTAGSPAHDLALEALRRRDEERKAENDELRHQLDALTRDLPRRLTDEQSRQIAERLKEWPAYRDQLHMRRVLILASPHGDDAANFARQIRMALEAGGVYSDDVKDFTWGSDVAPPEEHREANDGFRALHDANVTVLGSDLEAHEGERLDKILVAAFRKAGVDVTATPGPTQIGGQVAIVVGNGKLPEAARRRYDELRSEIVAARPRLLTTDQRLAITRELDPLITAGRTASLHILHGSCFDCGDYARDFQEVFEGAGFRVDKHSPGSHPDDDFHYGLWVRWDPQWRARYNFVHDGPIIAAALRSAGIEVKLVEREGSFTSLIVGARRP